jgi:hypothetical protein
LYVLLDRHKGFILVYHKERLGSTTILITLKKTSLSHNIYKLHIFAFIGEYMVKMYASKYTIYYNLFRCV